MRHGESAANLERRFSSHHDDPLTPLGIEQARLTGIKLVQLQPIQAVYCSPLSRALHTARLVGEPMGLVPQPVEDLQELDLGLLDGLTEQEIRVRYPHLLELWETDLDSSPPGAESLLASCRRAVAAVDRLVSQCNHGRIAVVTHAGVLSAYLSWLLDRKISLARVRLHNCSVTHLRLVGPPLVLAYDDIAHLDSLGTSNHP